jgi:hypothetical protein
MAHIKMAALLEDLPTEILTEIFFSCNTVQDVLALSGACRRFRSIYASSRRLPILEQAVDAQFGPLHDLTQFLTHNDSQPVHLVRKVNFTQALLQQMLTAGRVAETWADIYPLKKWKHNFEDRRLLSPDERRRVRRAIYRLWLYTRAFHNSAHPREHRVLRSVVLRRAELLRNWSTVELAEMADVHAILRDVVRSNVCPSNGTIARKFKKRFPNPDNGHQLLFNIHLNYPPPPPSQPLQPSSVAVTNRMRSYSKYAATPSHEPGAEGWGDDIPHYYVVEDMLKLDPAQILWLRDHAPLKEQVQLFVRSVGGEWFDNNGETWSQTLEWVICERGGNVAELHEAVEEGVMGVVVG